ncbi:rifin PIR protein,putative [Plasmodium sp. DRC-Itaito]|nr:rifin PIR protein,putative [Plasmodium sp. DRC-Itaito]
MNLQYSKILLFFLQLSILVTSYHAHNNNNNNNKPSITTPHHTKTNRSLCECDTKSSNYDKNEDMKSVKENFDRQTSQRFEEYEERMKTTRQKRKEERDKNIQKIIEEDKREKSLAEKVEKSCLRCGCGLGGVAASVGLFGGLGVYGWKMSALATAKKVSAAAMADATAKGAAAGVSKINELIKLKFGVSNVGVKQLETLFTAENDTIISLISKSIEAEYNTSSCLVSGNVVREPICTLAWEYSKGPKKVVSLYESIEIGVKPIVTDANEAASVAKEKAIEDAIKISTDAVESTYAIYQNAIIASVVTILVIVLVMIIIYLILRYRRKKKMKKKAEYTKLLNQ